MADNEDELSERGRLDSMRGRMKDADDSTRKLSASANAFSKAISTAFVQGVTGAKSFDTVLKSLALRLSTLSLNLALKPLTNALGSGLDKLFSGLGNTFTVGEGGVGGGGGGYGQPSSNFARGGVIAAPTYFPLGNGRTGLAGEAGPEAIMPLARGPDGRLGVAASGGAPSNITVNIATPDADSFRRSETYLTGVVARAVARGQRGM